MTQLNRIFVQVFQWPDPLFNNEFNTERDDNYLNNVWTNIGTTNDFFNDKNNTIYHFSPFCISNGAWDPPQKKLKKVHGYHGYDI